MRRDRSEFQNRRKRGGGVAFLIRDSIEYTELDLQIGDKTSLEIQGIRVKIGADYFVILNAYLPPYSTRTSMVSEFRSALQLVNKHLSSDQILVIGYFNMLSTKWEYLDEEPGYLTGINTGKIKYEDLFLETINGHCLRQINNSSNSRHNILDLVLSTTVVNISTFRIDHHVLLDNNTVHHIALGIQILYSSSFVPPPKTYNYGRIRLNKTKEALQSLSFQELAEKIKLFSEKEIDHNMRNIELLLFQIRDI